MPTSYAIDAGDAVLTIVVGLIVWGLYVGAFGLGVWIAIAVWRRRADAPVPRRPVP